MKAHSFFALLAAIITVTLVSSASAQDATKAIAVLTSASGSKVTGTVTFTEDGDGVKVVADVTGLAPGKHGFHVHEFGDCSSPDATSAGGHYNPEKHQHADRTATDRHVGDLGNLEADSSGNAHLGWTDKMLTLSGDDSVLGLAVIVHEKEDDLKSQPVGNAGGRLACGVIGVAKP
ncbi:MAG: superoxide dismutase family protein [Chthoniobacterales bacterium]|nr:superoxide dismutase family protein [Chthoniobacterales bacterium]